MKSPSVAIYLLPLLARTAWQAHTIGREAIILSDEVWHTVVSQPNATGQVTVPGYRITEPYPGSPADWRLTVSVKANVPLLGAGLPDDERFTTATELGFRAPDRAVEQNRTHPSWGVCQSFYLSSRLAVDGDGEEVRSDCSEVLGDSCREALVRTMRDHFVENAAGSNACSVPLVTECEGELYWDDPDENEFEFDGSSGTSGFNLEQTSRSDLIRFAAGNHSADDTDDYDRAIRQIWVAGIVFGYARMPRGSDVEPPDAKVFCVAATSIEEDSRGLEDGASGIRLGDGLGGTTAWAAMIIAAGFMAAMM